MTRHNQGNYLQKFGRLYKEYMVILPDHKDPPVLLRRLLDGDDRRGRLFLQHIGMYNSAFMMASSGADVQYFSHGPAQFKILGGNYHCIGSLLPTSGRTPRFAQLYVLDDQIQSATRWSMPLMRDLDHQRPDELGHMLRVSNPFCEQIRAAAQLDAPEAVLRLTDDHGMDRRRYNRPTAQEVAALIPDADDDAEQRQIVLRRQDG